IGVSVAEMAFAGGLGAEVFLAEVPFKSEGKARNDIILFSESNTRFVVEVKKKDKSRFEKIMKDISIGLIGCVSNKKVLKIYDRDNKTIVDADIDRLKNAWQEPLKW
ncbi:MAG: phosphoribosylformylglycinamidine synthase, partial [Candidatus Omnitrophica bacterium]|nr:phosphoribosylformylglycinamidine synthase [Candidatus Omnitrophota bacterium]